MDQAAVTIDRAATAIRRNAASRPCTLAIANEVVVPGDTVFDYGCGHGEDVDHLCREGFDAHGWDPAHRPDTDRSPADVVLCSYVLNVIEDPPERVEVLKDVHRLASRAAVVSVLDGSYKGQLDGCRRYGDGWITSKNTFQTVWSQGDARALIEAAVGVPPVALAPGVFVVFASPAAEEEWRERVDGRIRLARIRRGTPVRRPGVLEDAYDTHRDAFEALWAWVEERGRLPEPDEVPAAAEDAVVAAGSMGRAAIVLRHVKAAPDGPFRRAGKREVAYDRDPAPYDALWGFALAHGRLPEDDEVPAPAAPAVALHGSVGHAGLVLRAVYGDQPVEAAAEARKAELAERFAVARLRNRRARFSDLPRVVQRDTRHHFGSYKQACADADRLLMSIGDAAVLRAAAKDSSVGKITSDAVYVHVTALDLLPPALRVYDACGRVIAGTVPDANVVKFHLDKPRVSYLVYPDFDADPHPALAASWVVDLRNLDLRPTDYSGRDNPPVLHRKELFVDDDYPRYATFRRLTEQEERHGLLDDTATIGTRSGWAQRLADRGWKLHGHRLIRDTAG